MKDENKIILIRYIAELSGKNCPHDYIGRSAICIYHFLDNVETISRKEYRRYLKEHGDLYHSGSKAYNKEYLLSFLSFAGIGWRPHTSKTKSLDKLSKVSERNRQKIKDFIAWLPTRYDYSHNTISTLYEGVKQYFEYCNEFSNENIRRYIATLESLGRSPKTIVVRINAVATFGKFIGKQVVVKRPKVPRKLNLENVPTEAEYNRLCTFLKERGLKRYYLYIRILATSGCRLSEFLQLRWCDILAGDVMLKCKGNKYRRIFFPKSLQSEVKAFLSDDVKEDDYVAVTRNGTRMCDRSFSLILKTWGVHAGIPKEKLHAHAFRHFFAKKFLANNKSDVMALADMLGHSSVDTTRIYTQKSYDEQKRDYHRTVTW